MRLDVYFHGDPDDAVRFANIAGLLVNLTSRVNTLIEKEAHMAGELDALKASVESLEGKIDGLSAAVTSEIAELQALKDQLGQVADLSQLPALVERIGGVASRLDTIKAGLDADDTPAAPTP